MGSEVEGGGDVSVVRFSLEAWSASWTNLRKSAGGNGGEGEKETRKKKDRSYFFLSFYSFLTKKYCKKKHFTHPSGEVQSVF